MTREPILTSDDLIFLAFTLLSIAPIFVGILQSRSRWHSAPEERSPLVDEARAWLREVFVLWCVGALWPLQMLRRTWSRRDGASGAIPVVLVPGYLESETLMTGLRRALTQYGRPFATYKYKPLLGSGVAQSQRLHAFVQATANHFGSSEVDVVGHSYGGLLLRRMQQDSKCRGVRKLVLLAVPHHGSRIAVFAPGRAGRDLQPGSSFLKSLKSSGSFGETLDLRASCDAMIHPREAAILHDGSERLDGAWGHNSMLVAPETIQRVMRFLDDAVLTRPESD